MIFYRYIDRELFPHHIGYVFDALFKTKPFLNHEGRMIPWESIITLLSLFGFLDQMKLIVSLIRRRSKTILRVLRELNFMWPAHYHLVVVFLYLYSVFSLRTWFFSAWKHIIEKLYERIWSKCMFFWNYFFLWIVTLEASIWKTKLDGMFVFRCWFFENFWFWPIKSADLQGCAPQSKIWTRWRLYNYLIWIGSKFLCNCEPIFVRTHWDSP